MKCQLCDRQVERKNHWYCNQCAGRAWHMSQRTYLKRIVTMLNERGEYGANITGNTWYADLQQWQWITTEDDGYSTLTEHGLRAATRYGLLEPVA